MENSTQSIKWVDLDKYESTSFLLKKISFAPAQQGNIKTELINFGISNEKFYQLATKHYDIPELKLLKVESECYITNPGITFTENSEIIWSGLQVKQEKVLGKWLSNKYDRVLKPKTEKFISENVILLAQPGYNYGHWIVDILPKVYLAENYKPNYFSYIIKEDTPTYAYELLALLGVEKYQIIIWNSKEHHTLKVNNLFISPSLRYYENFSQEIKKFGQHIRKLMNVGSSVPDKKIFISRSNWKTTKPIRSLENINQVEIVLKSKGYTVVFPETLSFQEQIKLFNEAKIIIGEDGSALHNTMFANENIVVGNIKSEYNNRTVQNSLCNNFNQKIVYLTGKATNKPVGRVSDADFVVSLPYLRDFIEYIESISDRN